MSSVNLDLVRSILAAWQRGDFSSAEWADHNIEFVLADGPDHETARGLAGMAEAWRGTLGIWEGYRTEADEVRELDGEPCARARPVRRARQDKRAGNRKARTAGSGFVPRPRGPRNQARRLLEQRARARRPRPGVAGSWPVTGSSNLDLVRPFDAAWERADFRSWWLSISRRKRGKRRDPRASHLAQFDPRAVPFQTPSSPQAVTANIR